MRVDRRQLRGGELLALGGALCLVVSLVEPWYHGPIGTRDLWDTFGPGAVLLLATLCAALATVISAVTEREGTALPISAAVWTVFVGLAGLVAAIVRMLDTPEHASSLQAGAWLALAGALAVLAGAWQAVRDERPSLYEPARPVARPRP